MLPYQSMICGAHMQIATADRHHRGCHFLERRVDPLVSTFDWFADMSTGSSLLLITTSWSTVLAGTISLDSACIQSWAVYLQVEPLHSLPLSESSSTNLARLVLGYRFSHHAGDAFFPCTSC